jgi:hypothetical protein
VSGNPLKSTKILEDYEKNVNFVMIDGVVEVDKL